MKNLFYKIKCAYRKILPESTEEEKSRFLLRSRVNKLAPLPDLNDSWTQHRSDLRADIVQLDPRIFLSWKYIQYTMFHQAKLNELDELRQKPYWDKWKKFLNEISVGTPKKYPYLKTSSGNLIHHAYSLAQIKDYTDIDFSKLKTIVEFGGGYGSMARLLHNLGFRGTYIIFDLPEFLALQEYFLGLVGVKNVIYADTLEKLADSIEQTSGVIDLFIATWSLSEAPVALRESFFQKIGRIKNIIISYQNSFEGIDNVSYFYQMMNTKKEIEWKTYPIKHLPGNNYLIGKQK